MKCIFSNYLFNDRIGNLLYYFGTFIIYKNCLYIYFFIVNFQLNFLHTSLFPKILIFKDFFYKSFIFSLFNIF